MIAKFVGRFPERPSVSSPAHRSGCQHLRGFRQSCYVARRGACYLLRGQPGRSLGTAHVQPPQLRTSPPRRASRPCVTTPSPSVQPAGAPAAGAGAPLGRAGRDGPRALPSAGHCRRPPGRHKPTTATRVMRLFSEPRVALSRVGSCVPANLSFKPRPRLTSSRAPFRRRAAPAARRCASASARGSTPASRPGGRRRWRRARSATPVCGARTRRRRRARGSPTCPH